MTDPKHDLTIQGWVEFNCIGCNNTVRLQAATRLLHDVLYEVEEECHSRCSRCRRRYEREIAKAGQVENLADVDR